MADWLAGLHRAAGGPAAGVVRGPLAHPARPADRPHRGATAYGQLHADGAATAGLSVALGLGGVRFDGIGRLLFADRAAMLRARASQQVRRDATADEMRFVDHSRSQVTALHRIVPADAHSAAAAPTRSHAHT